MYRSTYNTQNGFLSSSNFQNYGRYTASTGLGQRAPLYPIGPTLTQPQFKPMQRGVSPSPYLARQGMKPPSYDNRYLQKAESLSNQINLTYEQRERRLIEKNQRQLEEEQKRRQQIRISYERQISSLSAKLSRNLQKKQKLYSEIELLQRNHENLNQKLLQMKPPQRNNENLQHIDRKQQQMIILKNRLMSSMRQNEIQLTKKLEQQEKHWQLQVADKQKFLFQMEQNLRDKRMQLHCQKQLSLQKPDLLSIQEEVRYQQYKIFEQKYQDLDRQLKNLVQNRQKITKQIKDNMDLRKPQFHNDNLKKEDATRQKINLQLRVKQLERVSQEMEAANQNLQKDLQRKQFMITKYEEDIHSLKSKKQQVQSQINYMMETARSRDSTTLSKSLNDIVTKTNEQIRMEQAKGARLKNAYQKLYQLLCSATSKNIHQAFSQSIMS